MNQGIFRGSVLGSLGDWSEPCDPGQVRLPTGGCVDQANVPRCPDGSMMGPKGCPKPDAQGPCPDGGYVDPVTGTCPDQPAQDCPAGQHLKGNTCVADEKWNCNYVPTPAEVCNPASPCFYDPDKCELLCPNGKCPNPIPGKSCPSGTIGVPPNCIKIGPPKPGPGPGPAPVPDGGDGKVATASMFGNPWLWVGLATVTALGIIGYTEYKKKHPTPMKQNRGRKVVFHRRRK